MSDFFAGINNIRMPQVVMNQGPLPGMGGLPAPLHDTADARINYNSSLLGDIAPYAYGEPGYLSSQTAYLNIPHRIQKVIPTLWLPEPTDTSSFRLCHSVDEGDLAFVMRLDRNSEICTGLNNKTLQRAGLGTAIDPFINLTTLNYLLAGLQICTLVPDIRGKWDSLMMHLDSTRYSGTSSQKYDFDDIKHIVEHLIRPFGVVHGKDNQGGQSEATMSSVQWPVSFVTNMILDGKDANIVNIWHHHDISAGDDLVLRLKVMPLPPGNKYTLNHYRKGIVEKTFPPGVLKDASTANNAIYTERYMTGPNADRVATAFNITHVWQLVPEVFSLDLEEELSSASSILKTYEKELLGLNAAFLPVSLLPWQHVGYWHIARTQVQSKKYGSCEYYFNDMAMNLRLGHIDSTFQPMFCAYPCKSKQMLQTLNLMRQNFGADKFEKSFLQILERKSTKRSGRLVASDSDQSFHSTPLLRLGRDIDQEHDVGKRKRDAELSEERQGTRRVAVHPALLDSTPRLAETVRIDDSSVVASADEDIGVFDDPGPVSKRAGDADLSVPAFTVPKPGLKSAARKPGKGKGVVSSVLGADGSVRLEQSRML